jgi:hypothetical protein
MLMLSQISASSALTVVCTVIMAVCAIVMVVVAFRRNTRREVALLDDYATTRQLDDVKTGVAEVKADVAKVNTDLQQFKKSVNDNGEIRKNTMLAHIEDVRTKLNDKIDRQTELLNRKIDSSTEAQTKLLISTLKGKHDS